MRRSRCHVFRQILVDVEQMRDHAGADRQRFHLAQFEGERIGDVLLALRLTYVKLPCLAVVVGEGLGAYAQFGPPAARVGASPSRAIRVDRRLHRPRN